MEDEGGLDRGVEDQVAAQNQAQAPGGNEAQKQKQNEEEFLRSCYLGKEAELEALATACGTSRVQHARDKKQRHALHLAASNGKTGVVRTLIARYACDADVEDKDGRVPLHFAASQGYTETVSCLCTFGRAWVDSSDGQDDTPLHLASRQGHAETCLELIQQGKKKIGERKREKREERDKSAALTNACISLWLIENQAPQVTLEIVTG